MPVVRKSAKESAFVVSRNFPAVSSFATDLTESLQYSIVRSFAQICEQDRRYCSKKDQRYWLVLKRTCVAPLQIAGLGSVPSRL